jgi:hypothetical protein
MTEQNLTAALAERVMGWGIAPDRFLMSRRRWKPRWRFQPLTDLGDAFSLLDKVAARYTLAGGTGRTFTACVQVGKRKGRASSDSKARSITLAIAEVLGLEELS